jgi:hypothetical protein
VTEAIAFIFLFIQAVMTQPRYATSEPCEHTFGGWRCQKREASVMECIELEDKRSRKVNAIYESKLAVSRDPQSGYASTWPAFVSASRPNNNHEKNKGGSVNFDPENNSEPLVNFLWEHVKPIVNDCSNNMLSFLKRLGVDENELSPLCRHMDTPGDLLQIYHRYFKYSSSTPSQEDVNNNDDNDDEDNPVTGDGVTQASSCNLQSLTEILNMASEEDSTNNEGAVDEVDADNVEDEHAGAMDESEVISKLNTLLNSVTIPDMLDAAREGIAELHIKRTGSMNWERKYKSLKERWLSHAKKPAESQVSMSEIYIERNMHVRVDIGEGRGALAQQVVQDYRVLGIFTKTYNKWFLCDIGKQKWQKGMPKGKYRVLLRMIKFDHSMGIYQHVRTGGMLWEKKSIYVLCDASSIAEVVGMLDVH